MSKTKLSNLVSSLKLLEQNPEKTDYFENFEDIICRIGALRDPESISILIQFLKDESDELDLMWGIIHTIEIFDDAIYIEEILKTSSDLYKNSPEWSLIVFMRIINSAECKTELIRQLRKSSHSVKNTIKKIMEEINNESPEFLAKTVPVTLATTI